MSTLEPRNAPQWTQVLATLDQNWTAASWWDVGVVVGCSGGADSVALLLAITQLRQRIEADRQPLGFVVAAHFNHALRGDESDADQRFVRQLAEQLDVRFVTDRSDGAARDEATLRQQRERFLLAVAKQSGARYVAVAHTLDDNVETILHQLMRGTGPRGLAGIAPHRPLGDDFVLARPLLAARGESLRGGLREIGQSWREDSSNRNLDYRRNWIRRELIPTIQRQFPDAVSAIGRAIDGQRQWREIIDHQATQWLADHRLPEPRSPDPHLHDPRSPDQRFAAPEITIWRNRSAPAAIVVVALQQLWDQQGWPRGGMSHPQWTRLASSILGEAPERYSLPAGIEVSTQSDRVTIRKGDDHPDRHLHSLGD